MAAHGGGGPPGAGKPPHVPRHIMPWLLSLPTTLLLVDVLTPPAVRLGPVMISAPVFAAIFCGPLRTLIVAAVTLCCIVLAAFHDEMLGTSNFTVQLTALLLITSAAVGAGSVRSRREQQLAQVRWVAEATQRVLLQPLPARLGSLTVASLYLAADDEAAIGGDLYAASRHGRTSRVLVGDAEGKGLAAAGVVSCVLSAFRRSSRRHTTLPEAAAYLEQALTDELVEIELSARSSTGPLGAERPAGEGFVTAVIVDFPDGTDQVRVLNRAHPPPLIVRDGEVLALTPVVPSLPLGLGDLFNGPERVDTADFLPGDTLLLYTDGVIEARDVGGRFYPLAKRLPQWAGLTPEELLEAVRLDLLHHTRARLTDDVAMVAVHRAAH